MYFFFSSRRRHTRYWRDWSSDVCSSDLLQRSAVPGTLASADLKAALTEDHNDTVPDGVVISSDPAPGRRAIRGSGVTVVISLGRPVVPDVEAGTTSEEAERAIQEADLSPRWNEAAKEFDDTVPVGAVIGLRPAPGTVLTVGAPVTVVISKGRAPTTVPDVRDRKSTRLNSSHAN